MHQKRILASLLALSLLFTACTQKPTSSKAPSVAPASVAPPKPVVYTATVGAVGDNLIHGSIFLQAQQRAGGKGYDFSYVYKNLASDLANYDLLWINQETLINDKFAPSHYPMFSTPKEMGPELYKLGFRVFSLSNNHVYDKGAGGIAATRAFWKTMPADVVTTGLYDNGGDSLIPLYQKNGIKFAFLSYTEMTNGLPTPKDAEARVIYTKEEELMQKQIKEACTLADVVVVAPHWGVEGSFTPTEAQKELARKFSAWGADVILGSHPHVLQPIEVITDPASGRQTTIIYSLGNFVSAQSDAGNMISGLFSFKATKTEGKTTISDVAFHPLITQYEAGFANIRVIPLKDYTDKLAAAHGVRARMPSWSLIYIDSVLEKTVGKQYLKP